MEGKREYVKKAFQGYLTNKNTLFWLEQELKTIPIPGESGMDYTKISVQGGGGNIENQFAIYAERKAELERKIGELRNRIELVRRTIEHFAVEYKAKGKRHYEYIQQRFLMRRTYRRAAIEVGIAERTADLWLEEIFTVGEAIGEQYALLND